MSFNNYPGIPERIKAVFADMIVMILFMFAATYIFSNMDDVTDDTRFYSFVFIFLVYDPLFTSLFGATIGHMIIGLRVKKESDEQKNIFITSAFVRYLVKAGLGLISLFTVLGNEKRKAIHDHLVGSVVIFKK